MIKEISNKGFLLFFGLFILISCSSSSEKGEDSFENDALANEPEQTETKDFEKLQRQLKNEGLDSAGVEAFLKEADLNRDLKDFYRDFYRNRDFNAAWIEEGGLSQQGEDLIKAIEEAPALALDPKDYKLQYLYRLIKKAEGPGAATKALSKLEKELTRAYFQLADHVLKGRLNPEELDAVWKVNPREENLAAHLQQGLATGNIPASIEALEPDFPAYRSLKKALASYKKINKQTNNWEQLPADLVLQPGDSSRYAAQLSQMLLLLGDLKENHREETIYSEVLATAVAGFQERHGLEADSIVAENTLAMLNVPVKERVDQIKLNMERFRWLPDRPKGRHVVVNIPEYRLYVYEGLDNTLSMRVIVGEAYESNTPVFTDSIEYIAFSPTWTVPLSISRDEILPRLRKDPAYLRDRNFILYESWEAAAAEVDPFEVDWEKVKAKEFPYKIVQQPGPNNSLGLVKFMFPNAMDIYLHDTPADYLFERKERDLSHGCIRVEKPVELSQYLLQEEEISRQEVIKNMNLAKPLDIILPEKVPVFIEYRTAWVGPEGKVHFREDIYGHDRKQMKKLQEALASEENRMRG